MILEVEQTLTATADTTAETPRVVEGLIIPWNKPGMTSGGKLTAARGSIKLPADLKHVKLLRDHSTSPYSTPVGYLAEIEDTDDGLVGKFHVARTPDGDVALTDVKEGVRDALSVELIDHQLDGDQIVNAQLLSVALVSTPAFSDARVTGVTASHTATPEEKETPSMPHGTHAAAPVGIQTAPREHPITAAGVYDALTRLNDPAPDTMLTAALKSMQVAKSPLEFSPQWVGELWEGVSYQRKIITSMKQRDLTGLKLQGFRWKTKPVVNEYNGHPSEVPSPSAELEAVEVAATRLAAANKLPIEFVHFGQSDVIASYFSACAESYAIKSDVKALTDLVAAAGEPDNRSTLKWNVIKAAAFARRKVNQAVNQDPDMYVVNADDWFSLIDLVKDNLPAYLDLIGVSPEQMVPHENITKGTLIVWCKSAVEHAELKGSPIRVNALDVATGATDEAVFGYRALLLAQPKGVYHVKFAGS